jgi:hypothetical protein
VPSAHPPVPHVIEVDPVELLQITRNRRTVLLDQFEEPLNSPTARPYRVRIAENWA